MVGLHVDVLVYLLVGFGGEGMLVAVGGEVPGVEVYGDFGCVSPDLISPLALVQVQLGKDLGTL